MQAATIAAAQNILEIAPDAFAALVDQASADNFVAPIVLAERANEVFECDGRDSPFMLLAERVRPQWRDKIPAIVHVDGTARVQTVERAMAPRFHALLEAYGKRSGMPVLLNTSFNLAGEPIVNRAVEGYSTFRRSGLDVLVAGHAMVRKRRHASAEPDEELA